MRNGFFIIALSLMVVFQSCSQNSKNANVPEKVQSAFSKKFPMAKKVKWEMENDTEWEAEFKLNGKEYSANFTLNGDWEETEYEIKKSEIPANIKAILDQNFNKYEIEEAEISETNAGKTYEFEIEVGEVKYEVSIDAQGKLTKKKEDDKKKDDDKD
jgi:uncharacterized membrane protein YkoI